MKFKEFVLSMLSDADGTGISSKRVIGFMSFFIFVSLIYINTYTSYKTPVVFVDNLMYIVLGVFLAGTLEYFSKRQTSTTFKTGDDTVVNVQPTPPPPAKPPIITPKQPLVEQPQVESEDFIKDDNT